MATWKCSKCGATKESRCKPKKCPNCGEADVMVKREDLPVRKSALNLLPLQNQAER